jgi:hypothetical protein
VEIGEVAIEEHCEKMIQRRGEERGREGRGREGRK